MLAHTKTLAPVAISASALVEVALFRTDNTTIALGELLETGITVTLGKAFTTGSTAVLTVNLALVNQFNRLTD
tara:strand:- start:2478 stop:2696 length:219 start_codon:yes stop_codon:yes gene_type:complete